MCRAHNMSDEEFESTDAGAAGCTPISVGAIKKGSNVLIKGFPCKVVDYSTAKTGKHGSAKANITGVDIFTGRKYEMFAPTSATAQEPNVDRTEYQLVDFNEGDSNDEGTIVSLMDPESGDTLDDLRIPSTDEYKNLREAFAEGSKDVYVTVLSAMGSRKILPQFQAKDPK